ncbi:MAG: hypothetical protein ACW97P_04900 [Candidatus Hodarchaeales archaeon]|jgi:hypothetical protein
MKREDFRFQMIFFSSLLLTFLFSGNVTSSVMDDFFVSTYSFDPSGTFVIENTSDLHNLCGIYGSYPFVGETWNLTVVVDMNSSSGVTIFSSTYVSSYQKHWEGALEFSVFPNHSQTQTYISHLQIDTTAFPLFDIALINSSGCANGSYKLEMVLTS